MKTLTFQTGIPTAPDVERLVKEYGVPKEGAVITYEGIAETIHEKVKSHRWASVVTSWRRQLYREHNILLRPDPGKAFIVANASERVHLSSAGYKSGLRKVARVSDIAQRTDKDRLTADEVRACDHIVRTCAALRLAAATCAKQLKLPSPENGK